MNQICLNEKVLIVHTGIQMTKWMEIDYKTNLDISFIDLSDINHLERILRRVSFKVFSKFWVRRIFRNVDEEKYSKIILFDSIITNFLCKEISEYFNSASIRFWLWNSISELQIKTIKKSVDLVYSFDPGQCHEFNLRRINQFLPYDAKRLSTSKQENINDSIIFVGSDKGRFSTLHELGAILSEYFIKYDFLVKKDKGSNLKSKFVTYFSDTLSYCSVLERYKNYAIVLELNKKGQRGLTLRPIECLFLNKKMITNNVDIINYDFYHPSNILVIDGAVDIEEIIVFIDKPYVNNFDSIKYKYSFSNWLSEILF